MNTHHHTHNIENAITAFVADLLDRQDRGVLPAANEGDAHDIADLLTDLDYPPIDPSPEAVAALVHIWEHGLTQEEAA